MYLPLSPIYAIVVQHDQAKTTKKEKNISLHVTSFFKVVLGNLVNIIIIPIKNAPNGDIKCNEIKIS